MALLIVLWIPSIISRNIASTAVEKRQNYSMPGRMVFLFQVARYFVWRTNSIARNREPNFQAPVLEIDSI